MQSVPIEAIPNQQFSARLGDQQFTLRIKEAAGVMVVDVTIGQTPILSGSRLVAGTPVIPYAYLEGSGNFVLLTDGDALPDYEQFGITQRLVYASADELAAL